jgi:hypothetical protein
MSALTAKPGKVGIGSRLPFGSFAPSWSDSCLPPQKPERPVRKKINHEGTKDPKESRRRQCNARTRGQTIVAAESPPRAKPKNPFLLRDYFLSFVRKRSGGDTWRRKACCMERAGHGPHPYAWHGALASPAGIARVVQGAAEGRRNWNSVTFECRTAGDSGRL